MNQTTRDIRSILSIPAVYRLLQNVVAGSSAYVGFVQEYIRPHPGDRILDIGCGPGDILSYLGDVEYVGFDENPSYIESAKARFGDRATLYCSRVSTETLEQKAYFDIVLAVAILHHLDDMEALQLCELARIALKPSGRFISLDACYTQDQSPLARWIISHDRGQYIRTQEEYIKIASQVFSNIRVSIRHDRLRIPYTHIIMEC
ncbi:MAG: methyltransferase domain-containing protein [Leptolyngbyaceae cyanobacterium RU_5_1]|nr:methyltransferase domain-containing protein [Leptolyngbyaceae cyanobacterium RU_5_1]